MFRLQQIDELTRPQHWYLTTEDQCYYFCEYTPRTGFGHSDANSFISNFKKPVSKRGLAEYRYKEQAIARAIAMLAQVLSTQAPAFWPGTTLVPIPPSRLPNDPEYDDRMQRVVDGICANTVGESRALLRQSKSYVASHAQQDGERIKPDELAKLYAFDSDLAPRPLVILFDDVLTTGCHFRTAKDLIVRQWPTTQVVGFFLARVARPDPLGDFEALVP